MVRNIQFCGLLIVLLIAGSGLSALAGGFRMHPKAPVVVPPPLRVYIFGYGGMNSGGKYNTKGDVYGYYNDGKDGYEKHTNLTHIPTMYNLEEGYSLGLGFGMYSDMWGGCRYEIEGSYDKVRVDNFMFNGIQMSSNLDFTTRAVMFNWLKEFPIGGLTGYAGPGVGWADTEIYGQAMGMFYNDRSSGFAWQLIAGVDFPLSQNFAFFAQYRYRVLSGQDFSTVSENFIVETIDNPSSHALLFGARVSF